MGFQELLDLDRPEHGWAIDCYLRAHSPLITHTPLDDALDGGLMAGLTILGGVASAGKSSLAVQIATNIAIQGKRVAYFTLDDSWGNIIARSMSSWAYGAQKKTYQDLTVAPFRWSEVLQGYKELSGLTSDIQQLSAYAFNQRKENGILGDAAIYEEVIGENLAVIDSVATTTEIDQLLKTAAADNEAPELVVVDYAQQYQTGSPEIDGNEYMRVSEVASRLQKIALSLHIPILLLSSLKKVDVTKDDPSLDWFRGSGVIGYASWAAIIITRGEQEGKDWREIKLHVVKNKAGKTGHFTRCVLRGPYSYVSDWR